MSAAISGMALGWDTAWALAALRCGVPLITAVPFIGQESQWPTAAQERYQSILAAASEVAVVSPGEYSAAKLHARNHWMVDHCNAMVALWSGASGGTAACLDYAAKQSKPIINLWDEFCAIRR